MNKDKKQTNARISVIVSLIVSGVFVYYSIPFLNMISYTRSIWFKVILFVWLFLICTGTMMLVLTGTQAMDNVAYKNKK